MVFRNVGLDQTLFKNIALNQSASRSSLNGCLLPYLISMPQDAEELLQRLEIVSRVPV